MTLSLASLAISLCDPPSSISDDMFCGGPPATELHLIIGVVVFCDSVRVRASSDSLEKCGLYERTKRTWTTQPGSSYSNPAAPAASVQANSTLLAGDRGPGSCVTSPHVQRHAWTRVGMGKSERAAG